MADPKCTAHPTETRPDEEVQTGRKPDGRTARLWGRLLSPVTGDFEHRGHAAMVAMQFGMPRSLSAAMPAPDVR